MNCRFCGTIVSAPPSECPKCGRPVSAGDFTRAANQAASATIVYRSNKTAGSPKIFNFAIIIAVVIVTVCAVSWSKYSRAKQAQGVTSRVIATPSTMLQSPDKPSAVISPEKSSPVASAPLSHPSSRATDEPQSSEPLVSKGPNVEELLAKAQAASSRGNWVEPARDNALLWAREARKAGSQQGAQIEERIYGQMMESLATSRRARDYPGALEQVNNMIRIFPSHTSLPSVKAAIQREQRNVSTQ